jgi:hypothetical protein
MAFLENQRVKGDWPMRAIAFSFLLFFILAAVSPAQAQGAAIGPGQTSCDHFWTRQNLLLSSVRPALEVAMRGGVEYAQPGFWEEVKMLGDGTSVAVLKTVSPKDLTNPEVVKAYLQVIRIAFSEPKWTVCAEDKTPEVTLFLLDYLREKVQTKGLQDQIDSTREFVLKQAGPPKLSPAQVPPQLPK